MDWFLYDRDLPHERVNVLLPAYLFHEKKWRNMETTCERLFKRAKI